MFYCTLEDLETQLSTPILIQLTNDTSEQDGIDNTVIEESLIYSSTLIDGYLRGRYTLPLNTQCLVDGDKRARISKADDFSSLPSIRFPLLRVVAMDLCTYRLYSRRLVTEMPEAVLNSYKNAIKTLENLQKGIITLETEENKTLQNAEYRTNKTEIDRLFNKRVISEY